METQSQRSALPFEVVRTLAQTAQCEVLLVGSGPARQVWKILRLSACSDPEALGRFMDEAVVCQRLNHPGVVRSVGAGRLPDGRLYLATEYLEGITLAEHLATRGPLAPDQALRLFAPICDALAYMHRRGVIHRDLRPGNIMLCGGLAAFRPRIMDFGLANFRGMKSFQTSVGAGVLPRAEYCAPECVRGHQADARSDLYALGITMFEAVTGRPPFMDADHATVLMKHVREVPPALPASCELLGPVIRRCLEKEPHQRFGSATEMLGSMGEFGVLPSARDAFDDPWLERCEKVGDVLGDHELIELLGEGAMGRVFLARHTATEQQVAIKVLKPEQAKDPTLVDRFFNESRVIKRIGHDHIVKVHDFVDERLEDDRRRAWCVMEALRGVDLGEAMGKGPLELKRAVKIIRQLCSALEAAHVAGVVHRDIKPDNVFLECRDGEDFVKVLDFGVAKLMGGPELDLIERSLAGLIIGTLAYMAPEQAAGRDIDARADIYSVGIILYQMLAGVLPFQGASFLDTAVKIAKELPPELPDVTAGGEPLPNRLKGIVVRCLEKDPVLRFPSAHALSEALARFEQDGAVRVGDGAVESAPDGRTTRTNDADPEPEFEPPRRSRAPWMALAAVVASMAAAAVLVVHSYAAPPIPALPLTSGSQETTLSAASAAPAARPEPAASHASASPAGSAEPMASAEPAASAGRTMSVRPAGSTSTVASTASAGTTRPEAPPAYEGAPSPAQVTDRAPDLSDLLVAPVIRPKTRPKTRAVKKQTASTKVVPASLGRDDLMNPYAD